MSADDGGARPEAATVDALTADDAMRCDELERVLFPGDDPWSARVFLSEVGSRHTTCFAARDAGVLVGYAVLARLGPEHDPEFEVHTIGVDPGHQGRGIGRALVGRMLAVADEVGAPVLLDVRTDNEPALGLYRAHGFAVEGLRPRYYKPSNADAYLMIRPPHGRAGDAVEAGPETGERTR